MKNHSWLKDFPWTKLNHKKILSPFIPTTEENFDLDNIEEPWRDIEEPDFIASLESLKDPLNKSQFLGYYYDIKIGKTDLNKSDNTA